MYLQKYKNLTFVISSVFTLKQPEAIFTFSYRYTQPKILKFERYILFSMPNEGKSVFFFVFVCCFICYFLGSVQFRNEKLKNKREKFKSCLQSNIVFIFTYKLKQNINP